MSCSVLVSKNKRTKYSLCHYAMMNIFSYGRIVHQNLVKMSKVNVESNKYILPLHGLCNKRSNNKTVISDKLTDFFTSLQGQALPSPERIVRTFLSIDVRNDSKNVTLPAYYTYRRLYGTFCHDNGYKLSFDSMCRQSTSTKDDNSILRQFPSNTICSWPTFLNFWKKNFPDLKIARPHTDTCSICYQYTVSITGIEKKKTNSSYKRKRNCYSTLKDVCGVNFDDDRDDSVLSDKVENIESLYNDVKNFNPYLNVSSDFNEDLYSCTLWEEIKFKRKNNKSKYDDKNFIGEVNDLFCNLINNRSDDTTQTFYIKERNTQFIDCIN